MQYCQSIATRSVSFNVLDSGIVSAILPRAFHFSSDVCLRHSRVLYVLYADLSLRVFATSRFLPACSDHDPNPTTIAFCRDVLPGVSELGDSAEDYLLLDRTGLVFFAWFSLSWWHGNTVLCAAIRQVTCCLVTDFSFRRRRPQHHFRLWIEFSASATSFPVLRSFCIYTSVCIA